jgi:hypothetical protein
MANTRQLKPGFQAFPTLQSTGWKSEAEPIRRASSRAMGDAARRPSRMPPGDGGRAVARADRLAAYLRAIDL